MKEVYLHKNDIPKSCVDCDFRQDTYCKAQRIDDGEYVSCKQSKSHMLEGKPITCPLKCIESGELCDREEVRKETAKEILESVFQTIVENFFDSAGKQTYVTAKKILRDICPVKVKTACKNVAEKYGIELFGKTEQVGNSDKLEDEE